MGEASGHAKDTGAARVAFGVLKDALADRPRRWRPSGRQRGCSAA